MNFDRMGGEIVSVPTECHFSGAFLPNNVVLRKGGVKQIIVASNNKITVVRLYKGGSGTESMCRGTGLLR